MALQSGNTFLAGDAYVAIRANSSGWKAQAQNALASLQAGAVTADFIKQVLSTAVGASAALTAWEAVAGLNAYATSQSYPTTMATDCVATITAAQAIVSWIKANVPTSGGFLLIDTINADGTITSRSFTTVQTAGLQTALTNFIATIG